MTDFAPQVGGSVRNPEPDLRCPSFVILVREIAMSLAAAGIAQPGTEARDLVAAVLDKPRFWPALHANDHPAPQELAEIKRAARRRVLGAPFAYAVGRASFRFLTLLVDERVLIPRPETEQLVDLVLGSTQGRQGGVVADVGTGSGAIALALSAEGKFTRVLATDVSSDALSVARDNRQQAAASLRVPVEIRSGTALAPMVDAELDVIVSNPPYIAYREMADLPGLVRDWEPSQALCCADDGLAVTSEIVADAPRVLRAGGLLALEVDSRRAGAVAEMIRASNAFGDVAIRRDFAGRDRFVLATRSALH